MYFCCITYTEKVPKIFEKWKISVLVKSLYVRVLSEELILSNLGSNGSSSQHYYQQICIQITIMYTNMWGVNRKYYCDVPSAIFYRGGTSIAGCALKRRLKDEDPSVPSSKS